MSETDLTSTTQNSTITASVTAEIASRLPSYVDEHIGNLNNPHLVTCEQINAQPYDESIVKDANYTHTDNNFTSDYKVVIDNLSETIDNIIDSFDNFSHDVNNINNSQNQINSRLDDISANIEGLDFSDFTKKSDYATETQAGIGKSKIEYGIACDEDSKYWKVIPATEELIDSQTDSYKPIVSSTVSFAIKTGLTKNNLEWSDEEKKMARDLLGIASPTITIVSEV